MASITFIDTVTHVPAEWANDVDALVYDVFLGAQTAIQAREAMGFGTLAEQDANTVQIAGGNINGTTIGYAEAVNAKFNEAFFLGTITDPKHLTTKEYVDAQISMASSSAVVITQLPLSGTGTIASPISLASTNVLTPTLGSRVLLKTASGTYEAVPTSIFAVVGNSMLYSIVDGTPQFTVPHYTASLGVTKPSPLLIQASGDMHITTGGQLVSGSGSINLQTSGSGTVITGNYSSILSGSNNSIVGSNNLVVSGSGCSLQGNFCSVVNGIQISANSVEHSIALNGRAFAMNQSGAVYTGSAVAPVPFSSFRRRSVLYWFNSSSDIYLRSADAISAASYYVIPNGNYVVTFEGEVMAWDVTNLSLRQKWKISGHAVSSPLNIQYTAITELGSTTSWVLNISSSHTGLPGVNGLFFNIDILGYPQNVMAIGNITFSDCIPA